MCGYVGGNSHILAKLSHLTPMLGSSPFCQHFSSPNTAPAARSSGRKKSSTTSPPKCNLVCSKLQWLFLDSHGTAVKQSNKLDNAVNLHSWRCTGSWYEYLRANSRIEGKEHQCLVCRRFKTTRRSELIQHLLKTHVKDNRVNGPLRGPDDANWRKSAAGVPDGLQQTLMQATEKAQLSPWPARKIKDWRRQNIRGGRRHPHGESQHSWNQKP